MAELTYINYYNFFVKSLIIPLNYKAFSDNIFTVNLLTKHELAVHVNYTFNFGVLNICINI